MTDYEDLAFDPAAGIDEVAELKKKLDIAVKALEKITFYAPACWNADCENCDCVDKCSAVIAQEALAKIKGE